MSKKFDVAVLGATGTVGQAMIEILSEEKFPINRLYPLASHRSKGESVIFNDETLVVDDVETFDFTKVQIALFSAGGSVSAKYAPIAARAGCIVIDNTSHFRNDDDIPLVIPEVNPDDIQYYKNRNIISNPNCSTIQMLVALKPIYDVAGISRINIATYQSVSGTGKAAIEELARQTIDSLSGRDVTSEVYPMQIAFNLIPHIDAFEPNGYTKEEMKMVNETRKILNDKEIKVNPTAVRVPVFFGHAEAIHIETKKKLSAHEAKELLSKAPGVIVKDKLENHGYPSPVTEASGKNAVFVGRIREDISHEFGLNFWVVADNIRKGAALNSIQIAQILVRDYL
ncbi:MAG: aspartate-semialdehyde dehydrogenase [Gammaproteobacteria bacterium]|jgi:aspartate-semialdehyde dehydrogenase|nr:aspartate-semialdehyde dehydrogenase [Gammaproteobacteria bacterium]